MNIIQNNVKHWNKSLKTNIRRNKRRKFILDHKDLFEKANNIGPISAGRHKSLSQISIVKEIAEKARKEIGYSYNTVNWDIFSNLLRLYKNNLLRLSYTDNNKYD